MVTLTQEKYSCCVLRVLVIKNLESAILILLGANGRHNIDESKTYRWGQGGLPRETWVDVGWWGSVKRAQYVASHFFSTIDLSVPWLAI